MYKLATFFIQYASEINTRDISHFRGAVIASLEKKNILFHNHEDDEKLRYSYPLIQYKRFKGKAAVMGIGKGIEAASQLLTIGNHEIQIGSRNIEMRIEATNVFANEITLLEEPVCRYRLRNWLPLNSENYKKYQNAENITQKIKILESILTGNILSFLKGVDVHLDRPLNLNITDITGQRTYIYKRVKLIALDIRFKTNITLPQYIGLGKNASVGCGVVTKVMENSDSTRFVNISIQDNTEETF